MTTWRLTGLHVPPPWRGRGLARHLVETALKFIADRAAGGPHRVYLEAVPYERDDRPADVDADFLRGFYSSCGFLPVPGHPFAMMK